MRYVFLLLLLLPLVQAVPFTYEVTDNPNLLNKCFYEPVNFDRYSNTINPNIVRSEEEGEDVPDGLEYGQLLNDDDEPWGGVTVRILWSFEGEERFFTTTTLTREAASAFGDESFEGYYFFNRARIGGATYRVEVVEETPVATAPVNDAPVAPEPVSEPVSQGVVSSEERNILPPEPRPFLDFLNKYVGIILSVLFVLTLIALYQWRFKKTIGAFLFRPPRFTRSVARLHKQQTKTFMLTDLPRIDVEASLRDLLSIIVRETYCLVEKEGHFLGLVTAEDLLEPLYRGHNRKIRDLLRHPTTLTPSSPFSRAAMLGTEYRVLPVVKNGVVVGVVMRQQLLAMYDELFSLNPSSVKRVAKLQHAITQAVTISPYDSVEKLIERMITEDTSTVVITEDKPQAIVTELHVLEELMDYRDTLSEMTVSSFGGRLSTVEATASLLDANRILLDAHLRALPVTHKGGLVGVLTQRVVLNELLAALKDYV